MLNAILAHFGMKLVPIDDHEAERKAALKDEIRKIDAAMPGWQKMVVTPDFTEWKRKQSRDVRYIIETSQSAEQTLQVLRQYLNRHRLHMVHG